MKFASYCDVVKTAWTSRDGTDLALLLSLRISKIFASIGDISYLNVFHAITTRVGVLSDDNVERCFASQVYAAHHFYNKHDIGSAFKHKMECIEKLISHIAEVQGEVWLLRGVLSSFVDLRLLFNAIRRQCGEEPGDMCYDERVKQANSDLMNIFQMILRALINDRTSGEDSKKFFLTAITNEYFAIAFQTNNFTFVNQCVGAISASKLRQRKNDIVTYAYYRGRHSILNAKYKEAQKHLSLAYRHCPNSHSHNIRLILVFLIPLNLLCGFRASEALRLPEYEEITKAVMQGNLQLFDESLEKNRELFTRRGVYLLVDALRQHATRSLIKKVYNLRADRSKHIISVENCCKAINFSLGDGDEVDLEETECLLANLIVCGLLKGNIFAEKGKVALSPKTPFPSRSAIKL
eukprot:m.10219 g.10219  ORF g.10219 m.10219 type:complete len:408 (-) comp6548_c0_seq1:29-1252(-)